MLFGSKRHHKTHIVLNNDLLNVVTQYEYHGHIIMKDLRNDKDVEKRFNKFYSSFNGILRHFKGLNNNLFLFIYISYWKPDYGLLLLNHKDTMKC